MKTTVWALPVGIGIAVAAVVAAHRVNRRVEERRLASYRYVAADPGGSAAAAAAYVERPDLNPLVRDPRGLAVDSGDRIVVAGSRAVVVLDRDGSLLRSLPVDAPALCVAVDEYDRVYVGHERTVSVYDTNAARMEAWPDLGENARLTSLAIHGGEVFAADAGQRTVWRMDAEGRLLGYIRGGGFVVPSPYFDVSADAAGVWVVNPGMQRVERYSREGERLSAWGEGGMDTPRFAGCCNPIHLARTPSGGFVTAEKGLDRMKEYDEEGHLRAVVADRFGVSGGDLPGGGDARIADLAVDSEGRVLALDSVTGRLRVWERAAAGGDE